MEEEHPGPAGHEATPEGVHGDLDAFLESQAQDNTATVSPGAQSKAATFTRDRAALHQPAPFARLYRPSMAWSPVEGCTQLTAGRWRQRRRCLTQRLRTRQGWAPRPTTGLTTRRSLWQPWRPP